MSDFFRCLNLDCMKVSPLIDRPDDVCPVCGSSRGEAITRQRFEEAFASGVYFDLDPKTGKRRKTKRS